MRPLECLWSKSKMARQINVQDPAHRRAYTRVNAQRSQCKESKERSGGKERMKKTSCPREGNRTHNPHLKRQGSSRIAIFTLFSCIFPLLPSFLPIIPVPPCLATPDIPFNPPNSSFPYLLNAVMCYHIQI